MDLVARVNLSSKLDRQQQRNVIWLKDSSFTVATFSKVHCMNYHRLPSQSHQVVIVIPLRFSYALWRSQFTLLFGKVRKSEMRGSPQIFVLYLHFNHKTDLTFLIKTFTIKVRSLCVVLMISPLVVRRTFYLIFNEQYST